MVSTNTHGSSCLRVLNTQQEAAWELAVARAHQHDIFHECRAHRIAETNGEGQARLYHYENGPWSISLPLMLCAIDTDGSGSADTRDPSCCDATSVYGYAGPIASHQEMPPDVVAKFHSALRAALGEAGVVCVFSRLHPLIPQQSLLAGIGTYQDVGPTVSIDLQVSREVQWRSYRELHRRSIRKLQKMGVIVEHDRELRSLDDFIELYYETMDRVRADDSYFFPKHYLSAWLAYPDPVAHLFVARHEGSPVSAAILTLCDGIAQYYLGGTANSFTRLGPNKLVIDALRCWAAEQGAHTLHLGGGVGASEDSLFHFKCGFSSARHRFAVWKWIVDQNRYDQLCRDRFPDVSANDWQEHAGGYFPAYRAVDLQPVADSPDRAKSPVLTGGST